MPSLQTVSGALRAGPGGRSSVSGLVATVFGATGFLGRYVVNRFAGNGTATVVPYRGDEHDYRHLRVAGDLGQIQFLPFQLLDKETVQRAVQHSDVVVNLIGQDFDSRHFGLEDVHIEGAQNIAQACADAGVSRLIHMSALGANVDSESEFFKTKGLGEVAVKEAFPNANIVRPSYVFGFEDRILNRFAEWHRIPFIGQPLFDGGVAKKRPVYSLDVAEGIVNIVRDDRTIGQTFEFVGPREYTVKEIVSFVNREIRRPNKPTYVPAALGRMFGRMGDKMPLDPIVSEQDVFRLVQDDVVSKDAHTLLDLGVTPTVMDKMALNWLRRFRKPSQHDSLLDVPH